MSKLCIGTLIEAVLSQPGAAFFFTPMRFQGNCYFFPSVSEEYSFASPGLRQSKKIEALLNKGYYGYALCEYEGGYSFEPELFPENTATAPFRFCFLEKEHVRVFRAEDMDFSRAEESLRNKMHAVENYTLDTDRKEYTRNIRRVRNHILQGNTYQINYTVRAGFKLSGDIANYFYHLLFNQSSAYTAIINTGETIVLSFSPELFIEVERTRLTTRPMKGTTGRGVNVQADVQLRSALLQSEKERAENVMIVDLLRNDAGRISRTGSVEVTRLFEAEKYETLYQMTSTVRSRLARNRFDEIFRAMFPCGSVTGAPKLRSMQIIEELEKSPRGIYTGSIGLLFPERMIFNVAIRTIVMNSRTRECEMGLGSGVVWDGIAAREFDEVRLKGKFATAPQPAFLLVETMLFKGGEFFLLDIHLNRLKEAADFFCFTFDKKSILWKLAAITKDFRPETSYRVRLTLSKWGALTIEHTEVVPTPPNPRICLSRRRVLTTNRFQYFKTTRRGIYDSEYRKAVRAGFFDAVFLNERGELAEGAITNIAVMKNGEWLTPPISAGILDGVYRKYLLREGVLREETLFPRDLEAEEKIIVFNSVRGIVNVQFSGI